MGHQMTELKRGIFLDRDNVINENDGGYILGWDEFEFLPGVLEAFSQLYCMDYEVFVVSNQSGISEGLEYNKRPVTFVSIYDLFCEMREEITHVLRNRILRDCARTPVPEQVTPTNIHDADAPMVIREFIFCPHSADANCACRKPKPGMIYYLSVKWGIDLSKSWMIGDQESDISAGWNARIRRLVKIEADANPHKQGTYSGWRSARTKSTVPVLPTLLNAVQFIQDVDKWEGAH